MARARIETMKPLLIGKDPMAIERHFQNMSTLMHTYIAHIPTISGIDMALWDLAGKITGLPVCVLLGGPFHGLDTHVLARPRARYARPGFVPRLGAARQSNARRLRRLQEQHRPVSACPRPGTPPRSTTRSCEKSRGLSNVREAVGDEIEIAVHCHNEFDTPSAIAVAKAVEPMDPLFLEDPLNVPFSEGWMALKRAARIPILTGEKLELVRGFRPFLITRRSTSSIPICVCGRHHGNAEDRGLRRAHAHPVALHNVGSLVLTYANAHFGSSIQNFYRSESALGRPTRYVEDMAASNPPACARAGSRCRWSRASASS